MIGLGAKYLTAAGFGRYRITAASLGSLDLFRWGWLKFATVQAIMAAFGADGTAVIRATNEYLNGIAAQGAAGKAKATALAGFINEDPMMVCSLRLEPQGVTMPIRYIDSADGAYVAFQNITIDGSSVLEFDGIGTSAYVSNSYFCIFMDHSQDWMNGMTRARMYYNNKLALSYRSNSNDMNGGVAFVKDKRYVIKMQGNKIYVDGTLFMTETSQRTTLTKELIFANSRNGAPIRNSFLNLKGVSNLSLVPCKHKVNGVLECGMLDLVSVTWEGNSASSGTLTIPDISYTPTP